LSRSHLTEHNLELWGEAQHTDRCILAETDYWVLVSWYALTSGESGGQQRSSGLDSDTAIGGPHGHFPSTQVSLLEATAAGLSSEAMDRLIALYWKPVYRFIRLKFHKNNEDAKDLEGFS